MSAISTILTRLRAAIWAIDVRDDIANAIEQCYSDVSNPTLKTEALEAALQNKIDQGEMAALTIGDHTITAAKLANGVIPTADATLTEPGKPADAAETGRQFGLINESLGDVRADLDAVENDISALEVISPDIKNALLGAFEHVMWFEGCSEYYDALVDALYTDIPVIKIYRGMGVSGASIAANEKRMLSDPIPFVNEAPITIRVIGENNDYAYNPKFINTQNGIVTSIVGENGGTVYFYDSDGVSKAFRADDRECTLMTFNPRVASKVYSSVSGEVVSGLRLLFADGSDSASELPTTQIPKYAIIQGIVYMLEENNT